MQYSRSVEFKISSRARGVGFTENGLSSPFWREHDQDQHARATAEQRHLYIFPKIPETTCGLMERGTKGGYYNTQYYFLFFQNSICGLVPIGSKASYWLSSFYN